MSVPGEPPAGWEIAASPVRSPLSHCQRMLCAHWPTGCTAATTARLQTRPPSQPPPRATRAKQENKNCAPPAGEDAIRHLFSRGTHREFGYAAIIVMLIFYFLGAAWTGALACCNLLLGSIPVVENLECSAQPNSCFPLQAAHSCQPCVRLLPMQPAAPSPRACLCPCCSLAPALGVWWAWWWWTLQRRMAQGRKGELGWGLGQWVSVPSWAVRWAVNWLICLCMGCESADLPGCTGCMGRWLWQGHASLTRCTRPTDRSVLCQALAPATFPLRPRQHLVAFWGTSLNAPFTLPSLCAGLRRACSCRPPPGPGSTRARLRSLARVPSWAA